ncbi:TRAP transporter substrate-binding protein [Acuticoccus sp.]|uniref:TRAP transporter substrate-binding protein n=1 Tax=Acuticoccus sp. TaxID=1904378 RepID=UPI003B51CD2B
MERRTFLKAAGGTAAVAATASLAAPAISQNRTEWRMVTTWPKNFPGQGTSAERLAQTIGELTDGRLNIKVFGAGEIVPAFESFDAVTGGAADCMHATPYYWQNKSKALNFFSTVPFGMTTGELNAWMKFGGGQELWDRVYDGFGLKGWSAGSTGVQMGGWYNKEINTVADLQGLKMRIPGLGGEALSKLGVTTISLPVGEIFSALQSGTIDATEWVGPFNDLAPGFYKVAQYYYWPGMHEPGTAAEFTVDKAKFEALPNDVQRIVAAAVGDESERFTAEFNYRNGGALDVLVREHGVQLKRFPTDVLQAWGEASGEVIASLRDTGDPLTKETTESFLKARRELMAWSRIGEQAFMNARLLDYTYG